jgi:hypothetical protein
MSLGVRVIGADRGQLRWEMVDLDSQLPDDSRAQPVWAFIEGQDLSEFYNRIKACDAVAGRPATDPQVAWRLGFMRHWRGSARRGRSTDFASSTRRPLAIPGHNPLANTPRSYLLPRLTSSPGDTSHQKRD